MKSNLDKYEFLIILEKLDLLASIYSFCIGCVVAYAIAYCQFS